MYEPAPRGLSLDEKGVATPKWCGSQKRIAQKRVGEDRQDATAEGKIRTRRTLHEMRSVKHGKRRSICHLSTAVRQSLLDLCSAAEETQES